MKKGLIMVSMNKKRVIKSLCAAAFLGAMIVCPQSSFADVPVPTLDRVKSENTTFINSSHPTYTLTELTADTTAPEGSITVKIDDTSYYYTPSENTDVLKSLASTGSTALIETTSDKALYTVGENYYTYDPSKLKDSAYTLTEAASADEPNTITLYDKNADGTVSPKYYTVSLN